MNRRQMIAGLAGTAAWPLAARAQQPARAGGIVCFVGRQRDPRRLPRPAA